MTPKQKKALDFIADTIEGRGIAPSLNEIKDHLGINKTGAQRVVSALVRDNYLSRIPHKQRALELNPRKGPLAEYRRALRLISQGPFGLASEIARDALN